MEGIEPVRMKPVMPPPAVSRARRKADVDGLSWCDMSGHSSVEEGLNRVYHGRYGDVVL